MGLQGASLSPPHGETGAASRASWELLRCLGHVWGAAQQAAPTALGRWGDREEKTVLKRHKALPEGGTQTSPATARRWKGSHKTMETEMNVMRGHYPNREGLKEQGVCISQRTFPTFVSACCWDAVCCGPIQLFTVHCSLLHCLWWEAILFYGGGSRALPLHPGQAHTGCANQKEQTCQLHLHTVKPQMLILSLNIQLCCAHGLLLPCSVRIWLLPNFVKHEFKTRSSFPKLLERSKTEAAFPSHHCNAGIPHCHACAQRTCFSIISCSGSVTVSFHCSSGWYRWDCSHFCLFFIP